MTLTPPTEEYAATFAIVNELGLHARAATKLVQLASTFACDVELEQHGQCANAKSVMGVLLLCSGKGSLLRVRARGPQAEACLAALGSLIAARFGEAR
jgi:phosphocarrier protein HPr